MMPHPKAVAKDGSKDKGAKRQAPAPMRHEPLEERMQADRQLKKARKTDGPGKVLRKLFLSSLVGAF